MLHKILRVLKAPVGDRAMKLLLLLLSQFLQLVWSNKVLVLYGGCMQTGRICKPECQCILPCAPCLKSRCHHHPAPLPPHLNPFLSPFIPCNPLSCGYSPSECVALAVSHPLPTYKGPQPMYAHAPSCSYTDRHLPTLMVAGHCNPKFLCRVWDFSTCADLSPAQTLHCRTQFNP